MQRLLRNSVWSQIYSVLMCVGREVLQIARGVMLRSVCLTTHASRDAVHWLPEEMFSEET